MADINVDVNLPSTISVDVTSPTQALSTNISIPGPQGPRGEKGNPTSINSLTAENIIITGANGNIVSTSGTSTIFISGNSGYFESRINTLTTNLDSTGSNLLSTINTSSGYLQTQINNLDTNYATDSQLISTGSTLDNKITSLSGYVNSQDSSISNNLTSTGTTLISNINTVASNLSTTGNTLNTKIDTASGYLQNQLNNLDNTYATDSDLISTGQTLNQKINTFSGTYQSFVDNLDASYATDTQLQNTGSTLSQSISSLSGTLTNNYYLKSNPSGFITGVDLSSYLTSANASSTYATINNLASTGSALQTQINNLDNTYATDIDLASTGSTLNTKINSLSGTLTSDYLTINSASSTYATITNLNSTGSTLQGNINALSSNLASTGSTLNSNINSLSGTLSSNYATISSLQTTGDTLDAKINTLSGYVNSQDSSISNNLVSTGSTLTSSINSLTSNLISTGQTLDTKINNLSGSSVSLYGDQTIDGTKIFRNSVYIHDLYVTGTEFIATTENNFVQSPYLLLNLTGGAFDGGIFFVTGSGLTGINDTGPIIGFDHTDKFKFGISSRGADLSTLNDIAAFQDITAYSGFVDGKYATIINLASTGSTLQNNINTVSSNLITTGDTLENSINSLSGYSNSTFATITNLASTGSTLQTNINTVSSNLVSTGNALEGKISSLSGTLTSEYATITNLGLTGSTLINNLANTGSTLQTNINSLSGVSVLTFGNQLINGTKTFNSGVVINVQPTGTNPALYITGIWNNAAVPYSGLVIDITDTNSKVSNTVGDTSYLLELKKNGSSQIALTHKTNYSTTIPSIHNTASSLNIGRTNSSLYFGATQAGNAHATLNNSAFTVRHTSTIGWSAASAGSDVGSQDLILAKDLSGILAQRNGTNPQQFRVYNTTGTNSGEFGLFGWQSNLGIVLTGTNALVIGTQASNSGILRDVIITGENIALFPGSGRLYINGTSSLNDHLLQTSQCSGNITGYITGFGFTGNYTGSYEGGYFLGRTKLTQNTVQLVESTFGSNYITKKTSASNQTFRSAALSSDGRYQIVGVNDAGGSAAGYIYVSNDYGNTWTPRITDTPRAWRGVAISADGKYQTACNYIGNIYVSNDYGNTWTAKESTRYWATVAMSSDGKYQTAAGGAYSGGPTTNYTTIYVSNDYGNTWVSKQSLSVWLSVTMSSDGKYQYAVTSLSGFGSFYKSSDYGNTWTSISSNLGPLAFNSISTSADGRFVIACRVGTTGVYISNDYGNTWVIRSVNANYNSVAISDNGKYMVAGIGQYFVSTGGIYFSSNYGATWKLVTPSSQLWTVAISSNAKYVIGTASNSSLDIHIFKADELIDGNLTINNNLTLPSGDFYSYNATGVNSGEFGLIGWRNNNLVIGPQQTNSGILRDLTLTGNNININASGVFNIFDNTNIVGNLNVTGNIFLSGNPVLTGVDLSNYVTKSLAIAYGIAL